VKSEIALRTMGLFSVAMTLKYFDYIFRKFINFVKKVKVNSFQVVGNYFIESKSKFILNKLLETIS